MREMQKCPNCGSTHISIDGVDQKKKGAAYYLSGAMFVEAGMRHGSKVHDLLAGKKENAFCYDCHATWHAGKDGATGVKPAAPAPEPARPAEAMSDPPRPAKRFCRKCGEPTEPGDMYCVQCGAKL